MFRKFLLIFLLVLPCVNAYSQKKDKRLSKKVPTDTSTVISRKATNIDNSIKEKPSIKLYKIINDNDEVTYVDTSLTIRKEYRFNYLRRDEFGLIPFANLGQTYNQLSRNYSGIKLLPSFGARARHYNYMEVQDINYYEVPTPLTELFYKSAFQQGQLLDAFFTANLSKQFNFSIAYKGLRSLGNYQHQITSTGNLRFTTNFKTKNNRYNVRAHIITQDLLNEENGGLQDEDIINFTSGNEDFIDRSVFDPNFQDAESVLIGKRFYINQVYHIISPQDSLDSKLSVRNVINFEDKYFEYRQNSSNTIFGESFNQSDIRDRTTLENFYSKLAVEFETKKIGKFKFGLNYNDINYGYNKVTILNNQRIPNRLKDKIVSVEGIYSNQFRGISFLAKVGVNILGNINGNFLKSNLKYKFNDDIKISADLSLNSSTPNYNTLLYQSDYLNYNWNNINKFETQKTYNLGLKFNSDKFFNLSINYSSLDNFTFFAMDTDSDSTRPFQLSESINLFKVRIDKEFRLGKFAIDNSILYQKVDDKTESLNLPEIVTRNTLYYSNHFFKKKALYLQTGIIFNYFTDYYMDGYDPILAEFYSQNVSKLGGFPRLDFFVNVKIRQTRIYFKAEHFNSSFTGYDYFSAPNIPYRDFTVRFGLVWNFFL